MMRSIEEQAAPGHAADGKAGITAEATPGRVATHQESAVCTPVTASDDASVVTGTTVVADGGFVTG